MNGGGGGTPQVTDQEREYVNVLQNILSSSNSMSGPVDAR